MATVTMKQLLEAGVHFGHQVNRWNPKMRRYIFGAKNGIYIIDLQQTVALITAACDFLRGIAAQGGAILFVGTKKQAQESLVEQAGRCGMFYVKERWIGGTLTNFETVNKSIGRLDELREMKKRGGFDAFSKKEVSVLSKELAKLEKNVSGLAGMKKMPDALFIIDPKREKNAVKEALKLEVPTVALIDTNADPDEVSYPIPGNDDAIKAIKLIVSVIADAVIEGRQILKESGAPAAVSEVKGQAVKKPAGSGEGDISAEAVERIIDVEEDEPQKVKIKSTKPKMPVKAKKEKKEVE